MFVAPPSTTKPPHVGPQKAGPSGLGAWPPAHFCDLFCAVVLLRDVDFPEAVNEFLGMRGDYLRTTPAPIPFHCLLAPTPRSGTHPEIADFIIALIASILQVSGPQYRPTCRGFPALTVRRRPRVPAACIGAAAPSAQGSVFLCAFACLCVWGYLCVGGECRWGWNWGWNWGWGWGYCRGSPSFCPLPLLLCTPSCPPDPCPRLRHRAPRRRLGDHPPVRPPLHPRRVPGGVSSLSAVALAQHFIDAILLSEPA